MFRALEQEIRAAVRVALMVLLPVLAVVLLVNAAMHHPPRPAPCPPRPSGCSAPGHGARP